MEYSVGLLGWHWHKETALDCWSGRSPKLKCCSNVNCGEHSANFATNRLPNLCKRETHNGLAAQINRSIKRMNPIESPQNGPLSASDGYEGRSGGGSAFQIC
ncbi:hypothetical protein CDAR_448571 [Caerostris darwini]|uniref:Uncharacterized protein n=1 Tax=Caerostris darwini TaxID=1538125 RepID=A0AAV4QIV1_9ARAC|nr:hypothetical protein CDAR_448571 [Caerostris darwini]